MKRIPINATEFLPTFQRLVRDIATALNGHVQRFPDAEDNWYAEIVTPDMPLDLRLDSIHRRLEIKILWPKWKSPRGGKTTVEFRDIQHTLTDEVRNNAVVSIGVGVDRSAADIAASISKRLLVHGKVAYDRAETICRNKEMVANRQPVVYKELAAYFGVDVHLMNDNRIPLPECLLKVSDPETVEIEQLSVTPEMAKKIIDLIRAG